MIVVSDTSPISNLMTIGQLDLLKFVFNKILIPEGVKDELEKLPSQRKELEKHKWITLQKIKDKKLLADLLLMLDRGESEAIVLAIEKKADYLIIDERKGRGIAVKYGLKITGLLGVLGKAKAKGIINDVGSYMDDLVLISGFRISQKLRKKILDDLGES